MGGSGRAAVIWDCLRNGIDPNLYYRSDKRIDISDKTIIESWLSVTSNDFNKNDLSLSKIDFVGKRKDQGLGADALLRLQKLMKEYRSSACFDDNVTESIYTVENSIASISHMKVSADGTTKLLLRFSRGFEVESVIIPWVDKGFSTVCVSSQVGCRQACRFCLTGTMGKQNDLTAEEILCQIYYANKVCRIVGSLSTDDGAAKLPPCDNVVLMGMGEPADNAAAVIRAVSTMADRRMFKLAQSKVTISTVAPDPSAFMTLGSAPASLAWSVHAVDDSLRKQLVPTTKYEMETLKDGLVEALKSRSKKLRRTMLEVALIDGVNDSHKDAMLLVDLAQAIMADAEGSKVVVNLIPFNDIGHPTYRTPSMEIVLGFQKIITDGGVLCYVRTTRGDEDNAACGQLATGRRGAGER
jgi:23S rRNA (adenine2503-C2)-methyltransferase